MKGANIAARISAATMLTPRAVSGDELITRSANHVRYPTPAVIDSAQTETWIDRGVDHINDQIDEQDHQGKEQQRALNKGVVAGDECVHEQLSHAGTTKYDLDHRRPTKYISNFHAHHGQHGDQAVPKDMPAKDGPVAETLCSRCTAMIVLNDVEQGSTRDTREQGRHTRAECEGRQYQVRE